MNGKKLRFSSPLEVDVKKVRRTSTNCCVQKSTAPQDQQPLFLPRSSEDHVRPNIAPVNDEEEFVIDESMFDVYPTPPEPISQPPRSSPKELASWRAPATNPASSVPSSPRAAIVAPAQPEEPEPDAWDQGLAELDAWLDSDAVIVVDRMD